MKKNDLQKEGRLIFYPCKKTLITMKLVITLLVVNLLSLQAVIFPQSMRLNVKLENVPMKTLFSTIEEQTNYRFVYNEKTVENKFVTINMRNATIDNILNAVLENTGNTYKLLDNNLIVIAPENVIKSQQIRISGRVVDANGNPLPGVNIIEQGTNNGTITDANGNYTIAVSSPDAVLIFSFVGYLKEEVSVLGKSEINVTMIEDIQKLDEVVVVGYGVMKKSDLTGAVVSVSSKDLTDRPVKNAFEALQGKLAGVDITTTLRPGTVGEIYIRGVRSLTASNSPLYVVDGIPLMSSSGIETINPQDIETINILKDASATAIYGSRGANGVVLITTKNGTPGTISLNYSGALTYESMVWRTRYMNVAEYIEFIRWAAYNKSPQTLSPGNQPSLANDAKIELFTADPTAWENIQKGWETGTWDPSKVKTYDWIGAVTQPNITHEHTLSGSGGTKNIKVYGSIGYLDNQGTVKGQEYQRYTAKGSIDITPEEWIQFGLTMNGTYMYQDYGMANIGASMSSPDDLVAAAARVYPYALPYDSEGNLIVHPGGQSRVFNVVDEWKYSTNQRETFRIIGALYGQVELIKGLRYRVNFGPDLRHYQNGVFNDGKSLTRGGSSYASIFNQRDFSWTLDNLLYYDKEIGPHKINLTLLQTASSWKFENSFMDAEGIPLSSMKWYNIDVMSSLRSWRSDLSERQLCSYMGRLNYNFGDKYLLTISGRWDGASQLAEGHKWSFFPSAALGWRIDQESFMKNIDWIDQFKLRLSYGKVGNSAVNPYTTKGSINSIQIPFGNTVYNGYTTSNDLSNLALGWEKTTQYNLGLDFSFYRGRISGVVDVYTSNTEDLIMSVLIPTVTGYRTSLANVGKTKNRGFDITLNTINISKNDFKWMTNWNIAWQKEQIVSLMYGKQDMVDNEWFIGQPINVIYNYERLGLWQATPEDSTEMAKFNANGHKFQPGMTKVKDLNGDYRIDPNNDRKVIGNERPEWIVGINNTIYYKNFDFMIFLTGRLKYYVGVGEGLTGMYGDQRIIDYWTPENTDAEYQKPFRDEAGGDPYAYTYYKDNSYIKIRNISIGYTLPKSLSSKLKLNNMRIYAQIKDAGMLWSNIKFRDGEYGTLYYNRGMVFGVNVNF